MKALFTETIFPKLKKIDNVAVTAAAAVVVEVAAVALSNLYFRGLWFTHRLTCGDGWNSGEMFGSPHK